MARLGCYCYFGFIVILVLLYIICYFFLLYIICFSFFVPSRTRTVSYSVFLPLLPSRTCTKLERGFEAWSTIVDQLPEAGARV